MTTIIFLVCSNLFMTVAWYGHLKYKHIDLWKVILISWLIALPESCLQVPVNRIGSAVYSAYQLNVMQEVITLSVFVLFAFVYLKEKPAPNHLISFVLLVGAVYFAFKPASA